MNIHSPFVIDRADSLRYRQACDAPAQQVFATLTTRDAIEAWWGHPVRGVAMVGGQLRFCIDGPHDCLVVEVTQAADGAVDWLVTDDHGHDGEWVDSVIRFRIKSFGGQGSMIDFEHEGLVPVLECYGPWMRRWQLLLANLAEVAERPRV